MNNYICNKCYCTRDRKKKSFRITQCGHIFCDDCLDEDARPCHICNRGEVASLQLKEPLLPKVASLFIPLHEAVQSLPEIATFQNMQTTIMQRRFHEIDRKYTLLKDEYRKLYQNMQILTEKYCKLRENVQAKNKKFMYSTNKISNIPSNFSHREIHINAKGTNIDSFTPMSKTHGNTIKFTPSTNQSMYEKLHQITIGSIPKIGYNRYSTNNCKR